MAGMMSTLPGLPGLPGLPTEGEYDAAVASGDLNRLFAILEKEQGLPAGYLARTAKIESSGNPNAKNPNSSAEGLFQFINSTGRAYGLNSSADKRDPVMASLAAAQLAGENQDYLRDRLGREPTAGELYLAHQQGAGGAASLLANPSAPAASVVGSAAARLNGGAGQTAGQLASRWTSKFGDPTGSTLSGVGMMAGADSNDTLAGGEGSDRVRGINSEPYKSADGFDAGNVLGAIGMALLSGTRQNPLGSLPQIMQAQQRAAEQREDRRYGMWRDERNFQTGRSDQAQQQENLNRQFGLQQSNTEADNRRADAAEKRAADAAGQPRILQDGSGAIVAVRPDGSGVSVLQPGQKIQTEAGKVEERGRIADAYGLQPGSPERAAYMLNGKLPEDAKAPTTKNIKQADGSEVSVQWDPAKAAWVPLVAPEGGNAVKAPMKLTEGQSKDLGFYNRGSTAMENLQKHEDALTSGAQQGLNRLPGVGNYATSEGFKLGNQAGREFLAAILRKDSGGAITEEENRGYGKIFLPQPGDTPAVLDQKRESRRVAIESIKQGLGTAEALARATPGQNAPSVRTQADYDKLAPGTAYTDPFGKRRIKGGAQ